MASTISSFFTNLLSVFLLLFHLGCFIFPSSSTPSLPKRRKLTFTSSAKSHTSKSSFSRSWTYIKHLICIKSPHSKTQIQTHPTNSPTFTTTTTSAPSSIVSLTTPPPPHSILSTPSRKRRTNSLSFSETDISFDNPSFPLRNDIFPCPTCGEIFHKTHLLDHHQSVKHAVSELFDGDSGKNIVRIIFKTGWNDDVHKKTPQIHRILKIHNSPKIVSRFEEYRESVKSKASKLGSRRRDERCIADGNELLRFHCSTFMCNLGQNGNSSLCSQNYCSVCGIIRSGFSPKMDGIATMSSSWKAHVTLPDDLEDEFSFMNVKRAILICRVVAGRIGSDPEEEGGGDKEEGGFDSVFGRGGSGATQHGRLDEDELIVFNPRAVLPCFAIVYNSLV